VRFGETPRELGPHPFRRNRCELAACDDRAHQVERLVGDAEIETRREPRHTQHAQRIFGERFGDVTQDAGAQIALAPQTQAQAPAEIVRRR